MVAIIHNNAKNTENSLKNTGVIDIPLTCLGHSLQLAINGAIDEVPEMKKAVASFKRLPQKLHKPALCEARITTKVKTNLVVKLVYRKINQSVATRWSSTCMLIESILNLEKIRKFPGIIY